MSDSEERILTDEEVTSAAGAASKKAGRERTSEEIIQSWVAERAELQQASGGARSVSGSQVPGDTDDGRLDAVNLTEITGGVRPPVQIRDDDDGVDTSSTGGAQDQGLSPH